MLPAAAELVRKRYGIVQKAGRYAFGWDSDMQAYAPNAHLASAVINWGPYYIKAVQDTP